MVRHQSLEVVLQVAAVNRFQSPRTLLSNQGPINNSPPEDDPLSSDRYTFDYPATGSQGGDQVFALPEEGAPKLQRPVLLVHGYNAGPGSWESMSRWLVRDGQNKDGGIVKANSGEPIDPEANVFSMEFAKRHNPMSINANELKQVIDRIAAATGSSEVDVVGHSKGGLDARTYLEQNSNEKIGKLVMIATPYHGSVLADLELTFRDIGIPILPPIDDPGVRQTLKELSEVRGDNNPVLAQLNKSWDKQRSRAEVFIISGNGTPTLKNRFLLTLRGDGVVSRSSSEMPNVPTRNIWSVNHGSVKDHPDTLRNTAAFLTGAKLLADSGEPPNVPADREIKPQQVLADSTQIQYVLE